MSQCVDCGKELSKSKYRYCRVHMKDSRFGGRHHTEASRKKIADTLRRIGRKPPAPVKAPLVGKDCPICGNRFEGNPGLIRKQKYCSHACRYIGHRKEPPKCSECGARVFRRNTNRCIACHKKWWKGDVTSQWRGGVTKPNKLARNITAYDNWRKAVFERDDYTCQFCGVRGGKLHADHIKQFALYVSLRYELSNGRTLCVPCHKQTPTYARNVSKAMIEAAANDNDKLTPTPM